MSLVTHHITFTPRNETGDLLDQSRTLVELHQKDLVVGRHVAPSCHVVVFGGRFVARVVLCDPHTTLIWSVEEPYATDPEPIKLAGINNRWKCVKIFSDIFPQNDPSLRPGRRVVGYRHLIGVGEGVLEPALGVVGDPTAVNHGHAKAWPNLGLGKTKPLGRGISPPVGPEESDMLASPTRSVKTFHDRDQIGPGCYSA